MWHKTMPNNMMQSRRRNTENGADDAHETRHGARRTRGVEEDVSGKRQCQAHAVPCATVTISTGVFQGVRELQIMSMAKCSCTSDGLKDIAENQASGETKSATIKALL